MISIAVLIPVNLTYYLRQLILVFPQLVNGLHINIGAPLLSKIFPMPLTDYSWHDCKVLTQTFMHNMS